MFIKVEYKQRFKNGVYSFIYNKEQNSNDNNEIIEQLSKNKSNVVKNKYNKNEYYINFKDDVFKDMLLLKYKTHLFTINDNFYKNYRNYINLELVDVVY